MPNPLINRQLNTAVNRKDQPLPPEPEDYEYESPNIPYRGGVDHGVKSDNKVEDPPEYDPALDHPEYALEPVEPEPVPVRIVQSGAREIRSWRVTRAYVTGSPALISDQNDQLSKVTVRNTSTDTTAYIGDTRDDCNSMFGYPLLPGDSITINTSRAVYGCSETGTVQVAIMREYVIEAD